MAVLWELLAMGTILLSSGWLITVEAPGQPRHPPSTQLDAVVNKNYADLNILRGQNNICFGNNKTIEIMFLSKNMFLARPRLINFDPKPLGEC